jgi:hypothetical protein
MGRSLRSVLLEAAMELLPPPQDLFNPDDIDLFDLYGTAARESRRAVAITSDQTSFSGINFVTDRELAIILLGHLRRWYEDDAKENPEGSLVNEQTILGRALALLPMPCAKFTQEDLIREADERQHVRFDIRLDEKIEMIR